jgi:hypothetical protein
MSARPLNFVAFFEMVESFADLVLVGEATYGLGKGPFGRQDVEGHPFYLGKHAEKSPRAPLPPAFRDRLWRHV